MDERIESRGLCITLPTGGFLLQLGDHGEGVDAVLDGGRPSVGGETFVGPVRPGAYPVSTGIVDGKVTADVDVMEIRGTDRLVQFRPDQPNTASASPSPAGLFVIDDLTTATGRGTLDVMLHDADAVDAGRSTPAAVHVRGPWSCTVTHSVPTR